MEHSATTTVDLETLVETTSPVTTMAPGIVNDTPLAHSLKTTQQHVPKHSFPENADTEDYARSLDAQDPLRHLREKYIIPTKASLKRKSLGSTTTASPSEEGVYFCGNSLGLQPKCTAQYIQAQLDTWSSIGVAGHFTQLENSPLKPWQSMADFAAGQSRRLVGAQPGEVAIANTLTVNLHLLMASFYRPTEKRNKILLEWKAFPSDHVSVESKQQERAQKTRRYNPGVDCRGHPLTVPFSMLSNRKSHGTAMTPKKP